MRILFLTLAGPNDGLGHLLRCRTLMLEMSKNEWNQEILFLGPPSLLERWSWPDNIELTCLGESLNDEAVHDLLKQKLVNKDVDWVIIDGYRFRGSSWQVQVNESEALLLMFDDIADRVFTADAVLNQNGTKPNFYIERGINATHWLLGSQYTLVEPEYIGISNRPVKANLENILVVFGGADRRQLTQKSASILQTYEPNLYLDVVLGPYACWNDSNINHSGLTIHRAPAGLMKLMERADLIVTAAGSTVWQSCVAGCPGVVVQTADNQEQVVTTLRSNEAAIVIDADMLASELPRAIEDLRSQYARERLVERARKLVDGAGASRVLEALTEWRNCR